MKTLGLTLDELKNSGAADTTREIAQQPAIWREAAAIIQTQDGNVSEFLQPLLSRDDLRIVLTGAGTSAFAGEILAPALSRQLNRRVDAVATTDIVSNPDEYLAEDLPTLLVSFARSGNSPESIAATELADHYLTECHHLLLTCDSSGRLYRLHEGTPRSFVVLMPEKANDQGFAMTSSFTSMLLSAWLILARVGSNGLTEQLASAAERLLFERAGPIRNLAEQGFQRVVYLGSGPLKGLARESALKMLELTAGNIVTQFDTPMGFRHGPKAVLDKRTLVVVYLSSNIYTRQYDLDLFAELRQSMFPGHLVGISASPPADASVGSADDLTNLNDNDMWYIDGLAGVDDAALVLPFVVVAQLLALHLSLELGLTPDNPFPDNQVNRVVQGVTIHSVKGTEPE